MRGRRSTRSRPRSFLAIALATALTLSVLTTVGTPASVPAGANPDPSSSPTVPAAHEEGELLYVSEGNRLRRIDIASIGTAELREEVFIPSAGEDPERGLDINGTICPVPGGDGAFVASEDTGQPDRRPGWGVFEADGTQVGKLAPTSFRPDFAEPHGCAFAPDGTLFGTDVGVQGFGADNGQLIMWFPPHDVFPGEPGTYPNTAFSEGNHCKLAVDLGTAGSVAVDHLGRVYVAQASGLEITRFSPPFPTSADADGGCGDTDALGSPLADEVQRETFVTPGDGMLTFAGLTIGPEGTLYASSVLTGHIAEYDLDGNLLRKIVAPEDSELPVSTGHPQGLALDSAGTLYYADLDLRGTLPNVGPGPNGKVWRVTFDEHGDPRPPEIVREGYAFPDGLGVMPGTLSGPPPSESRTYAGGPERQFFFADEEHLTPETAPRLQEKWRFRTGAIITGSPAVAAVDLPGEGLVQVVYFSSWDGFVYAVRFSDGSEIWRFEYDEHHGAPRPAAASLHVEEIDGTDVVLAPAGQTVYALSAATGEEVWRFEAGTGCRDEEGQPPGNCDFGAERNLVESSVIVADGNAFFGMNVDASVTGKGGFYAVDVRDGTLAWYFDVTTGSLCTPFADDEIRNFDGYHSADELGVPEDFFATRPGCDFAREPNGCGNVWSSPALDLERERIFFGTANCTTSEDPESPRPAPPMPFFEESLVALDLEGNPLWRWRPREVDNDNLDFGAVPNLFTIDVDGTPRDVVGIGNKDGSYTVVDRDGLNVRTSVTWEDPNANEDLPYWRTKVVPGGRIGGVIATASVDEESRRVRFATAPGFSPLDPQRPTVHVLDLDSGSVVWQNEGVTGIEGDASYGPTSGAPRLVTVGSVVAPVLRLYDSESGELVFQRNIGAPGSLAGIASGAVILDGTLLVGHGIGQRSSNLDSQQHLTSWIPSDLVAMCVPGAPDCPQRTFTARYSDDRCAALQAVSPRLGFPSVEELIRTGVRGFGGVAAEGGAFPITYPPANDGPCEIEVDWPTDELDRVTEIADAWGVNEDQIHNMGGHVVLVLLFQALWGSGGS